MAKTPYAVVLFIYGYLLTCEADGDCSDEACDCGSTYLICQDLRLGSQIPRLSLDLDTATEILDGILPPNLTELVLMYSNVTNIQDAALDGSASTIRTLSFTNSKLKNISNAFLRLKNLAYLTIADTYIQDWNTNAMLNIGQTLESLSLSNVGLSIWPSWLKQFPRLTTLGIEGCSISSIPDDAFDLMANSLTTLSLNNNSLKAVPKAFSKLTAINILYLEHNMISNVTWLPQVKTLSNLDLSGNKISNAEDLSRVILPYASSLTVLELDNNRLTSIPDLHFLTEVTVLYLTNNLISDPSSGTWPLHLYEAELGNNLLPFIPKIIATTTMSSLHLPYNVITEFSASDLSQSIRSLELQYNLITKLTDSSFPVNSSLLTLSLSNNLINFISAYAFANIANLWALYLGGNKLARVPLALSRLIHLETLVLTDNPGLVCTCFEKSLRDLMLAMSEFSVEGTCGETSIYQFYAVLSTDCPD